MRERCGQGQWPWRWMRWIVSSDWWGTKEWWMLHNTNERGREGGGRRTEGVRRCYMHMRHNLEKPKTHICFLCSISIMTTSQSHNRGRGWQWSSTCQTDWGARHLSLMHHGNLAFFYFVKNVWNICRLVLITNLVSVNINLIYFDLIHFLLFFILSI